MITSVKSLCEEMLRESNSIAPERKIILEKISSYISGKLKNGLPVNLIYICTHNSRRSHFGQIWAHVAASFFKKSNIRTFSGGTEATALNENAIKALKRIGFQVLPQNEADKNPVYEVRFDADEKPIICFSKTYDHPANPKKDFAAIMTCGDAEENCPFVPGTELRIATTYDDPKAFDNTDLQEAKYDERCRQIGTEIFYMFAKLA